MLIFRWAAASNDISLNAMIFPVALYFWQIPHFMALTYLCRDDLLEARVCSYIFVYSDNFFSYNYFGALFKMYSLADASGHRISLVTLRNSMYLIPLGFLAYDCE
ncbi:Protoheme IX farnesyltransferase, mitochondrial [Glycine soja]